MLPDRSILIEQKSVENAKIQIHWKVFVDVKILKYGIRIIKRIMFFGVYIMHAKFHLYYKINLSMSPDVRKAISGTLWPMIMKLCMHNLRIPMGNRKQKFWQFFSRFFSKSYKSFRIVFVIYFLSAKRDILRRPRTSRRRRRHCEYFKILRHCDCLST